MKQQENYCMVLSADQLNFLAGSKYGIDRMKILHQLIKAAVVETTEYSIKGFHTTLNVGQAIMSEVDLANKLRYDKKTISRVLDRMDQLGIVTTKQSNRTSVHTLKCISAWFIDGQRVINPFYVFIKDRTTSNEASTSVANQPSLGLVPKVGETQNASSDQNIHSQTHETMDSSDDNTQSSFPSFNNAPLVFSEDGDASVLVPAIGNNDTDTTVDTPAGSVSNELKIEGQVFNGNPGYYKDQSDEDDVKGDYTAAGVESKPVNIP